MNLVSRPLQELQFTEDDQDILSWVQKNSMFSHNEDNEYLLLIPHPKHASLGGLSFVEFTEECPDQLKTILEELYQSYLKKMQDDKWTSDFDLSNDFGFLLIAFI